MLNKTVFLIAFFVLSIIASIVHANPNLSQDEYLWLEFVDELRNADGSITQPLLIHCGQYPSALDIVSKLTNLQAFYTFGHKDKTGKDIFYKLTIKNRNGISLVEINSRKENWVKVYVMGIREEDKLVYDYLAIASFFIFPKKNIDLMEAKTIPATPNAFNAGFNMRVYRERIIEVQSCNRKRRFPIRIIFTSDHGKYSNRKIKIINDRGEIEVKETDKDGHLVYTPGYNTQPQMEDWNKPGWDIIETSFLSDKVMHKVAYTILFQNRLMVLIKGGHNLKIGIILFLVSVLCTTIMVLIFKKGILS